MALFKRILSAFSFVLIVQVSKSPSVLKTENLGRKSGEERARSGFFVQVFLKIWDHGQDLLFSKIKS